MRHAIEIAGGFSYLPNAGGIILFDPYGGSVFIQPGDNAAGVRDIFDAIRAIDDLDEQDNVAAALLPDYFPVKEGK